MKTFYILEFGLVDGNQVSNQKISNQTEALTLFKNLIFVLSAKSDDVWAVRKLSKENPRRAWKNKTHFVSITRQDGSYTHGSFASTLR